MANANLEELNTLTQTINNTITVNFDIYKITGIDPPDDNKSKEDEASKQEAKPEEEVESNILTQNNIQSFTDLMSYALSNPEHKMETMEYRIKQAFTKQDRDLEDKINALDQKLQAQFEDFLAKLE